MNERLCSLPACPVETTLTLIGNKWQVLILRDLNLNGVMRFKELQRSIGGISQKVLTTNLRTMEESGIVHREVFVEVPPRVEYSLTDLGRPVKAKKAWLCCSRSHRDSAIASRHEHSESYLSK